MFRISHRGEGSTTPIRLRAPGGSSGASRRADTRSRKFGRPFDIPQLADENSSCVDRQGIDGLRGDGAGP
jgi:hypothetical protein